MIQYFLYIWLSVVVLLLLKKPQWGICFYIPYFVLVPYYQFPIFNYILFAVLLFRAQEIRKIQWKIFYPFLFYYLAISVILPFHESSTPMNWQMNNLRGDVIGTLVFPILIANEIRKNEKSVMLFQKAIVFCIFVACVYGLYLTQTKGVNPYAIYMGVSSGSVDANFLKDFSQKSTGRLFGRISSCFYHPMLFALFLGFSTFFLLDVKKYMKKKYFLILLIIVVLNVLFCGVRSVIAALIISTVVYLVYIRKIRVALTISVITTTLYFISGLIPGFQDYLNSIVDTSNKSNLQGSSIDLRIKQIEGCFNEIRNNIFFGKGYAWHMLYMIKYTVHPVILAFESLIFAQLCDNGIYGIIVLVVFTLLVLKSIYIMHHNNNALLLALFSFYIVFSCITGEYGYMKYFMLFYIIMIGNDVLDKRRIL